MPVSQCYIFLYSSIIHLPLTAVICRLINKLRSVSIVRPDIREDGITRLSNMTKFLAACASYGLPEENLFHHDDLIEATGESLARVARTIIALFKFVETPAVERSKFIYGQSQIQDSISGPYAHSGSSSRATASTPNLVQTPLSVSPTPPSPVRRRYSPPSGLPPVRSDSPDSIQGTYTADDQDDENEDNLLAVKGYPRPPLMAPPPKSPLRARSVKHMDDGSLFTWAKNAASPSRADLARPSIGDTSVTESVADARIRQSVASSAISETTMNTEFSSILDFSRSRSNSNGHNKFGTIRTITTDATSEAPSISRTEGSAIADELSLKKGVERCGKHHRDRRVSEGPVVDLSRVVEEADESASSSRGGARNKGKSKAAEQEKVVSVVSKPKPPAINLRQGKWPDDFMDAFPVHSPTRATNSKSPSPGQQDCSYSSTPISVSPPRKHAIVEGNLRNESLEDLARLLRKPTHPPRHSLDGPVLMPKESVLGRDGTPDGMPLASGRIMLRRHSTKPGPSRRNNVYSPPDEDPHDSDSEPLVPFPETVLGESGPYPGEAPIFDGKPRVPRGRFRSDIDFNARRFVSPNSYDELGAGARRSRFESMINLGVASNNASDLLRDSTDSNALRQALILREDGKPPTHFVCFPRPQLYLFPLLIDNICISNWATASGAGSLDLFIGLSISIRARWWP